MPGRRLVAALRQTLAAGLQAWLLLLQPAHASAHAVSSSAAARERAGFEEQVDALVREGYERPAEAVAALAQLQQRSRPAGQARQLLQAIGSIEAQAGHAVQAGAAAERLLAMAADEPGGVALAAANLVRAQLAETQGQLDVAAALAQAALPVFESGCKPPATARGPAGRAGPAGLPLGPDCDYRSAWRALQILQRRAMSMGLSVTETAHASAALALAERAGDPRRQATNLGSLALYAQGRGERELAQRLMAQAQRLALQANDLAMQSKMRDIDARLAGMRGEHDQALRYLQEARLLAALGAAPRLEARMLTNLSDAYVRKGRPADALRAAERALPVVRSHNDLGTERVLINNAGIAKIGLGRIAEGKLDMARLMEMWQRGGETGRQAETLREFGEALAAAGDTRSAVELFHQERALSAELMKVNRSLALKELQTRNDAEARQRDIDLLSRDNALNSEALANRELLQRIGWLLALLMVAAMAAVALLYWRVRETHRRLAASQLQLQSLSERDPLTNLANRRHFHAVMPALTRDGGFEGALLLVDIDHFKRVNDEQGHAAGDEVLVEVARRLNEAVRSEDLVVRWGGEEFLILAAGAAAEQAEQIARRVLTTLGRAPVVFGGRSLAITVSIGYGHFPLPPDGARVAWEQALNLADMALYTAKNQGRNRAVGIRSATAATPEALSHIEADFDRAWHDGRISLLHTAGP